MPRVTHLLFSAAFIFADYLCFIQDSSAVFVLASRGMAVSLFFLMSSAFASSSSIQEYISFLLQCPASQQMPYGITVLYDGWSFLSLNYI